MSPSTKMDALLELARNGPIRARDLEAEAIPRTYLKRLTDAGRLEHVARGLYRLADHDVTELHTLVEVAKKVPSAVVCLLSALQVHGLTTESPHAVWILIETHAHKPQMRSPKLEIVRASGPARTHGVVERVVEGVPLRITSPAKTVADCFRYRRHVGLEVALDALRDFLRSPKALGRNPVEYSHDALTAAARAARVHNLMRPYIEALA